jgi:hypothetical protein
MGFDIVVVVSLKARVFALNHSRILTPSFLRTMPTAEGQQLGTRSCPKDAPHQAGRE